MSSRPSWNKVRVPTPAQARGMADVRDLLSRHRLETVCQAARCPNAVECWSARTATFMLLGSTCTRNCRFCSVETGYPGGVVDRDEPGRVASAVEELRLKYVVLTSVDRDDLADGGSAVFAEAIRAVSEVPAVEAVEALIPDFGGDRSCLDRVASTRAAVIGHNVETVRRLTPRLRDPRAGYDQSLKVLRYLRSRAGRYKVKSGIMVGLGETDREVQTVLRDLRQAGVDIVTLGQYLPPSGDAFPVARYVPPAEFRAWENCARSLGFPAVIAGPLVRSSYHATKAYVASCG